MSPERRALMIEALIAIHEQFARCCYGANIRSDIERMSDATLTLLIANVEALIERAQQTDV